MNSLSEITEKAQSEIANAFYENAKLNAAASDGLLIAYEPNFERFPYQSLSVRRDRRIVEGSPLDTANTFIVASVVDKRCKGLEDAIKKEDAENGSISSIGEVLDSGTSAIFASDHLEIVDIAYQACGISAVLRSRGISHRSGLILSKAASDYMGVDVKGLASENLSFEDIKSYLNALNLEILEDGTVPVREFLKLAVDVQYLVIPNTDSFADLRGMQQDAVNLHNYELKNDIASSVAKRRLRNRPPLALFVAMPGTKTKKLDVKKYWQNMQIPDYHQTIPEHLPTNVDNIDVIGKFADGVTVFTSGGLTYASTIRLRKGQEPISKIDPKPIHIDTPDKLKMFAHKLIRLIDSLDGSTSVYDMNPKERRLPILKN